MENAIKFYDHLEYFTAIWYSFWSFGIFLRFWYVRTKNNLATLHTYTLAGFDLDGRWRRYHQTTPLGMCDVLSFYSN
jgi:hypothetical protein